MKVAQKTFAPCSFMLGAVAGLILAGANLIGAPADEPAATPAQPAEGADAEAEKAWKEVNKAMRPPAQPEEWANGQPTNEERAQYRQKMAESAAQAADKAKDFHTRFPKHAKAAAARQKEQEMLQTAARLGNDSVADRLAAIEADQAKDPNLSEEERVRVRAQQIQREAMKKQSEGRPAVMAAYEQGARGLLKDFPKSPIPYQMLLSVAQSLGPDQARKVAEEFRDHPATPAEIKDTAAAMLKKFEAVGKPLPLKFTAVDGREVELAKLRGKVVLIDFWATWCGPCVAEIPNVVAAYEKLHPKGFEIIGISFDQKKEALTGFIAKEKMTWAQFFDGQGWQNKFGQEFGINSIPAMWLVDKKGVLRDQDARGELEAKVEKLLAEKAD